MIQHETIWRRITTARDTLSDKVNIETIYKLDNIATVKGNGWEKMLK